MSTAYPTRASFVPAPKWHNLAEEVLDDPDGYYEKVEKRTAQRQRVISERASRNRRFVWPWNKK